VEYYVGPETVAQARGIPWLGDYAHDGNWQHFEIPVADMKARGYQWDKSSLLAQKERPLLGFQAPANISGTELNLDAVFFYKKNKACTPPASTPVVNEGTGNGIDFKLDSRSDKLDIVCTATSGSTISDVSVKLKLNGVELAGRWQGSVVKSNTKYKFSIPSGEIHGWKNDRILSVSFDYKHSETLAATTPILHKIGTGTFVNMSTIPDSIANGSDFYIIYMDSVSQASLGEKVKEKTMLCDMDIWSKNYDDYGLTMTSPSPPRSGLNALGVNVSSDASWVSLDIMCTDQWGGGALVAILNNTNRFSNGAPNLKPVTDNPTTNDYYFHFAIKRRSYQVNTTSWELEFFDSDDKKDNTNAVKYYVGQKASNATGTWLGDYTSDDQWNHFEIPVLEMCSKGYEWKGPLNGLDRYNVDNNRAYLLGIDGKGFVQSGSELNLDAMFFYKKPKKQ
jgi:hypothetical protein